jgi:hypothetical protein
MADMVTEVEYLIYLNGHEFGRQVMAPKEAREGFSNLAHALSRKPERYELTLHVRRESGRYELLERKVVGGGR